MGGLCVRDDSKAILIPDEDDTEEYEEFITKCFRAFAGSSPHNKKSLYMNRTELKSFISITNIKMDIEQIYKSIDTAEIDNKITANEFYEYFCDININPNSNKLRKHISSQDSYNILLRALTIFDIIDNDKSGKLEQEEIYLFGKKQLQLDNEGIQLLWEQLDEDDNGYVTIVELYNWFKSKSDKKKKN